MPLILDALCLARDDAPVRRLIDALGTEPVETTERRIGEPAVLSQHLLFGSGGEIVLHDDAVVAVILHLAPTPSAPRGLDAAEWLPGVDNDATFADFKATFDVPWRFADGDRYFVLEAAYLRPEVREARGPSSRRPAAGGVHRGRSEGDVPPGRRGLPGVPRTDRAHRRRVLRSGRTVYALVAGVEAGVLKESSGAVSLADLRLLHASALMERVESQVTCTACGRVACLTLYRDAPPTFGYHPLDAAMRRPLEAIPPVEEWGDADRIAEVRDAMRYVDHEPGLWFLVEQHGDLYLDSRYTISSMADDSCLIRLDEAERQEYHEAGRDSLTELARRIDRSGPHREASPFHRRNLLRHPDGGKTTPPRSVAAIAGHTWLARQKQAAAQQAQSASAKDS